MKKNKGEILELETTIPFKYKFRVFLIVFVIVLIVFLLLLETKFKIKQINVTGNTWYTAEEITDTLQTGVYDKYSLLFKLHYFFSDIPEMPFVESVSINFDSTDSINIKVYEKNIVGCVYEMGEYIYFDKDGYIVSTRVDQMNNVPRIEGLEYKSLTINKKLEVQADDMYDVILELTQLISKYNIAIDIIEFDENQHVTLYCTDKNQIYIGKQDSYDVIIQAIPNILTAAEEKTAIYWLDMSEFSPDNTTISAEFIDNYGEQNSSDDNNLSGGDAVAGDNDFSDVDGDAGSDDSSDGDDNVGVSDTNDENDGTGI